MPEEKSVWAPQMWRNLLHPRGASLSTGLWEVDVMHTAQVRSGVPQGQLLYLSTGELQ